MVIWSVVNKLAKSFLFRKQYQPWPFLTLCLSIAYEMSLFLYRMLLWGLFSNWIYGNFRVGIVFSRNVSCLHVYLNLGPWKIIEYLITPPLRSDSDLMGRCALVLVDFLIDFYAPLCFVKHSPDETQYFRLAVAAESVLSFFWPMLNVLAMESWYIVEKGMTPTSGEGSRLRSVNHAEIVARRSKNYYIKSTPEQKKTTIATNTFSRGRTMIESTTPPAEGDSARRHSGQSDQHSQTEVTKK